MAGSPTPTPFTDTHCHLDAFPPGERAGVLQRARDAGVGVFITVGAGHGLEGNEAALELAGSHPDVYAVVGVHPHDAGPWMDAGRDGLDALARSPRVVGVGETGLDFYHQHSPRDAQQKVFHRHITMARERRLPLVIHCRDAHAETLGILEGEGARDIGGVFHCFSGDRAVARRCLDLGFLLSFAGNVTFKKADHLRDALVYAGIEHILLETDCPYLAPEPVRGKRNEPSYLPHTAKCAAALTGLSVEDVARITSRSARDIFRLPGGASRGVIAYPIRDSLYLNITNRCTNACVFCPKFTDYMVKGHYLRLGPEPSLQEVLDALPPLDSFSEVVFCGFGESTLRPDILMAAARRVKEAGKKVRLDTDGLATLVHGRSILPDLAGLVDSVSVSLNAADAATYAKICPSSYGERSYPAVKEFIRDAKAWIPEVTATAVALPGIDMDACRAVAEKELGVAFRVRPYNIVG